jgi:hypothetical protein
MELDQLKDVITAASRDPQQRSLAAGVVRSYWPGGQARLRVTGGR